MTAEDLRPIWYLDHPLWQYVEDVNAIAVTNGWRIVESRYNTGGGVTGPPVTVDPAYTASLANPDPMIGVGDIPGGAGLGDVTSAQLAASQATQNTKITALESGKAAGLLTGNTDPTDDATTAWKVGQIYENTATGARFRSTAASTAPPAPAGSAWEPAAVWTETTTTSTPAVIDIQERLNADKATVPTAANGIRYVFSTHEDDTTIIWKRADDATPFAVTNTNVSGDGNPDMLPTITSRTVSTRGELPTATETNNATLKAGDMVLVKLPDGTNEIYEHDGTTWALVDTDDPAIGAPEHLALVTFPSDPAAFTPSVNGTRIRFRHVQTYTVTRTNDADAGTPPTLTEIPAPGTRAWVTVKYPTAPAEQYEWQGAAYLENTTFTSPGQWNQTVPALAEKQWITFYADVGPDNANSTGLSVGVGGDDVTDPQKKIRLNLPAGATLQGSTDNFIELTGVGDSVTIIGLGSNQYAYERHTAPNQIDSKIYPLRTNQNVFVTQDMLRPDNTFGVAFFGGGTRNITIDETITDIELHVSAASGTGYIVAARADGLPATIASAIHVKPIVDIDDTIDTSVPPDGKIFGDDGAVVIVHHDDPTHATINTPHFRVIDKHKFNAGTGAGGLTEAEVDARVLLAITPHRYEFVAADFGAADGFGRQSLPVLSAATHGKGRWPDSTAWGADGLPAPAAALMRVRDDDSGNLTISVASGQAFDGFLSIKQGTP